MTDISEAYKAWERGQAQGDKSCTLFSAFLAGHGNALTNRHTEYTLLLGAYTELNNLINRQDLGSIAWKHDLGELASGVQEDVNNMKKRLHVT